MDGEKNWDVPTVETNDGDSFMPEGTEWCWKNLGETIKEQKK